MEDLTGQRFNQWTVLKFSHKNSSRNSYWICQCDCGKIRPVMGSSLKNNRTSNCGCVNASRQAERLKKTPINFKYGLCRTKLYSVYYKMIQRCYRENDWAYEWYGARGISVCDYWQEDFKHFYDWAQENGYKEGLTLDRIDVNGDYSPDNCRWVTQKEQCRNTRANAFYTINGVTKNLSAWCEESPIKYETVRYRLKKGWGIERALSEPVHIGGKALNKKQEDIA